MPRNKIRPFCYNPACQYHVQRSHDMTMELTFKASTWPYAKYVVKRYSIKLWSGETAYFCGTCKSAVDTANGAHQKRPRRKPMPEELVESEGGNVD